MSAPLPPIVAPEMFTPGLSHAPLSPAERAVVAPWLLAREAERHHLVVALSGSHVFGFPSPGSDIDLKCVHVAPTRGLLGLRPPGPTAEKTEVVDGIELDYSSNEVGAALAGVLGGNGNYLERLLGPVTLQADPALEGLQPLLRMNLHRRFYAHYRGFAHNQRKEAERRPTPKRVLYVLRTTLTGAHLLLEGALELDLSRLALPYGFPDAQDLINTKQRGEQTELSTEEFAYWRGRMDAALQALEQAHARSALPAEAPEPEALEAWLVALRLGRGLSD